MVTINLIMTILKWCLQLFNMLSTFGNCWFVGCWNIDFFYKKNFPGWSSPKPSSQYIFAGNYPDWYKQYSFYEEVNEITHLFETLLSFTETLVLSDNIWVQLRNSFQWQGFRLTIWPLSLSSMANFVNDLTAHACLLFNIWKFEKTISSTGWRPGKTERLCHILPLCSSQDNVIVPWPLYLYLTVFFTFPLHYDQILRIL